MVEVSFSFDADEFLGFLERDPRWTIELAAVNFALGVLAGDPGSATVRRRRVITEEGVGLWLYPFYARGEMWAILWLEDEEDGIVVEYIGPPPAAPG